MGLVMDGVPRSSTLPLLKGISGVFSNLSQILEVRQMFHHYIKLLPLLLISYAASSLFTVEYWMPSWMLVV